MTLVFEKTLRRATEVRSFQIHREPSGGWRSCETADHGVAQKQHHTDWHHVERIVARFTQQIATLRGNGWQDINIEG